MPTSTQGTQAWDRYAFVNNNPVRYTDPTGHCIDGISTILCLGGLAALAGGLIGAGSYIFAQSQAGAGAQINVGELALAAGVGAAAGVAIAVGTFTGNPILVGAGVGAAFGGGSDLVGNILSDETFDSSDFAIASAGNALVGAALPWSGGGTVNAMLLGVGTNQNVLLAQEIANANENGGVVDLEDDDLFFAWVTGLAGGFVEGLPSGSELGTTIRTIISQTIQNFPAPDDCEEDYYCE